MKRIRAVFPGSFDPLTRGHVDIINRTLGVFDEVIVAILNNPHKATLFSTPERKNMIEREFSDRRARVKVMSFSGLLVEFAKKNKAKVIIRGLRAISDYDYEAQMALMNKNLWPDIETLFMIAREENSYVSSTLVRQVASLGGDVSKLVTPTVEAALEKKLKL
jgi:pantetheine-phosphate adenylyltransferase